MSDVHFVCLSDTGRKRTLNEDAWCADEGLGFGAVFDGMGGHGGGDVASRLAAKTVLEQIGAGQTLEEALFAAHRAIRKAADRGAGTSSMGCTAAAMVIRDGRYTVSWLGDSRCYLFDEQGRLWQLSRDHSFVQRLVDGGVIDDAGAAEHPERHVVTQCLGDPRITPEPETLEGWLEPGQRILLCSDGLSGEVNDDAIEAILQAHDDDESAAQALIDAANQAGGTDNITVALLTYSASRRLGAGSGGGTGGKKGTNPMRAVRSKGFRGSKTGPRLLRVLAFLAGLLLVAIPSLWYFLKVHQEEWRIPAGGSGGGAAVQVSPIEKHEGQPAGGRQGDANTETAGTGTTDTAESVENAQEPADEIGIPNENLTEEEFIFCREQMAARGMQRCGSRWTTER